MWPLKNILFPHEKGTHTKTHYPDSFIHGNCFTRLYVLRKRICLWKFKSLKISI